MWPFKRVPRPSPKRLSELEQDVADVQGTCEWLRKAIRDLNARMATVQRQAAKEEKKEEESAAPASPGTAYPGRSQIAHPSLRLPRRNY